MSEDQMQVLVKDILAGVQLMITDSEANIRNETRVLLEAQDRKIGALAEQVVSLGSRMDRVEKRLNSVDDRLFNLENDVSVIKSVVTSHSEELYQLKRVK